MTERQTAQSIIRIIESEPAPAKKSDRPDWKALCVCGHLEEHHSESVGGSHPAVNPRDVPYELDGCTGAMRNMGRRKAEIGDRIDFQNLDGAWVNVVPVTCPCKEFRPVAEIDRLGGRFRQRVTLHGSHPMLSGVRAVWTIVQRMAEKRGADPEELFEARFRWTADLVCQTCLGTDGVFPSYTVPGKEFGLLCAECRDKARATLIL